MYGQAVSEVRTEKITVLLTPTVARQLDAWREQRRWTRSTAIAVLVEQGLSQDADGSEAGKEAP